MDSGTLEKLRASITRYDALSAELDTLTATVSGLHADEILSYCQRLEELREQIRQADQELSPLDPEADDSPPLVRELNRQRRRILTRLQRQNDLLFSRINGMMAVVSADISQAQKGKAVLNGYGNRRSKRGGTFRQSC